MPISEFHFAFCGIATVAATLTFACARRAALALIPTNLKADVEAGPPEERSLKRKLDDSDEHDLDTPRPMKRNRTPPTGRHDPDEDEWDVIVPPPTYEQAIGLRQSSQDRKTVTPDREPTPPVLQSHPEVSQPDEKGAEAARCSTPKPVLSPNKPEISPPLPVTPLKPAISNAFSSFSASTSPFASYSNPSGVSPFALSGQSLKATPAWKRDNDTPSDPFSQANSGNALDPSPNDALSSTSLALSQTRVSSQVLKSTTCLTGEENETVEAELKGVKLFTKRGRKEFTDGMYGHIKILAHKSTPINGDPQETDTSRTRLLFRRDPLGQVSMNVGLHPTVTTDGENSAEDVVIYALKPGRASKADFLSFAKTLCDHETFQSRDLAAPGDAAAP